MIKGSILALALLCNLNMSDLCFAEGSGCTVNSQKLENDVTEVIFPNARFKLESSLIKLKVSNQTGSDWTSASTGKGTAQITAFEKTGSGSYVMSHLIAQNMGGSYDWAFLLTDRSGKGSAYFMMGGELQCLHVSLKDWDRISKKSFGGSEMESAYVYLSSDENLDAALGMK